MTYFLDLFSGIGGFHLGASWAGLRFDSHYYSEVDPYAISVYGKRFPDSIALGDIRAIHGADLPQGDWIIAGGFPCQDISVAGKGAGLQGARSGLWYEYARLIGELRPRYAIMENVGALAFRGLDSVLGSLAALGYDAEWQDIRASDVGAPHRRERLWIVAYASDSVRRPIGRGMEGSESESRRETSGGRICEGMRNALDGGSTTRSQYTPDVPDTFGDGIRNEPGRRDGQDGADTPEPRDDGAEGVMADAAQHGCGQGRTGRPNSSGARESEQPLQNVADTDEIERERCWRTRDRRPESSNRSWWATEPDVGRVAHGVPARVDRLKCLGNSIVPQIAELIFSQSAFNEWRHT